MKAYVFRLNGEVVQYSDIRDCMNYESDMQDLFALGRLECEDCSSDNSGDIITVEEIEVKDSE